MGEELKNCPFCDAEMIRPYIKYQNVYKHPEGTDCFAGKAIVHPERYDAWNTRSDLAVEVKPLEWVEEHDFHCSEIWDCETIIGRYFVFKEHDRSTCSFEFEAGPNSAQDGFPDIDAAKAAAQADYNARILSALTTRSDEGET